MSARRPVRWLVGALVMTTVSAAWAAGGSIGVGSARAAAGRTLRVGAAAPSISATLALAAVGDVVLVPRGVWREHVVVAKALTLRGEPGAIIDGGGRGTPVRVTGAGARVVSLSIRNSGTDLGASDACVYLTKTAKGAQLRRCTVRGCAFGIYVDQTPYAKIVGNRVFGSLSGHRSNRGNGIHLFDASRLVIADNHISGGRDGIYVSATEDSLFRKNFVEKSRYCVHYMFSYRNRLVENSCTDNAHGYALMESRYIVVRGNIARGNEGRGLLFRDAENCTIVGNRLEANGQGLFFYSSIDNVVTDNIVRGNAVGAKIWAGSQKNRVERNQFIANKQQVFYVGSSDLVWGKRGPGNYFSDYLGWDQNNDGIGDRPYRVNSFSAGMIARFPAAALLLSSPALELLSLLESRMPLLRTPTVIDRSPLVKPPRAGGAR